MLDSDEKVNPVMTRDESPEMRFSDPEAPELPDYRPVDLWVVLAIIVAILSFTAFLMPVFWIVPILGTLFSIMALRSVLDETRPTMGRKGALFALVISLFVLGCAPARHIGTIMMTNRQARAYADAWLEMVRQGRLPEAHQLTLNVYSRVGADVDLATHYEPPEGLPPIVDHDMPMLPDAHPSQELESFFGKPGFKPIVEAGENVEFEFVRSAGVDLSSVPNSSIADLRYVARYTANGKLQRADLRILMERSMLPQSGLTHWRVRSVDDVKQAGIRN